MLPAHERLEADDLIGGRTSPPLIAAAVDRGHEGEAGVEELDNQVRAVVDKAAELTFDGSAVSFPAPDKFAAPIAFNVLPQVDVFLPNGYTKEEAKMENEGRKIMHHPAFRAYACPIDYAGAGAARIGLVAAADRPDAGAGRHRARPARSR